MKTYFYLFTILVFLFACNNEDLGNPQNHGLQVSADFLKLSDSNGTTAGNLVINADVPEVTLRWNTGALCNLDTTQTTLKLSKGSATLPVKWLGKLENGAYGPEGVAFKAGVQIIAGEKRQYVPLVWANELDSTKILNSAIQTRGAGDAMPRVAQITMLPTTVNMSDQTGGSMYIGLIDVSLALFDFSEFTSEMKIDMSKIPNYITDSQMLDFKWASGEAPDFGFSARIIAMSEGLTQIGVVQYIKAPVPPSTLEVNPSSHTIGAVGQTVYSNITSNTNWTVSSNVAWITPIVISATNLSFIVAPNTTTTMRTGTVTVTAGSVSRTVSFTQQGAQQTYRVYYNADGGAPTPTDNNAYSAGATVYAASAISKNGYTFVGWRRSDNGADIAANSTFAMPAADVVLTAQWKITKSSFKGTVTNCSNVYIVGGGRWIVQSDAIYNEYTFITAQFGNVQAEGSKFYMNANGTVTIQPGTYLVKLNGSFNIGGAGGAVYIVNGRALYYRTNNLLQLQMGSSYFKLHTGAIVSNGFSSEGTLVNIPYTTTIQCDAQIVGQDRPWGWTSGTLTISSMEIVEL